MTNPELRAVSETYLLTLASRLAGELPVRSLMVLVEEADGRFSSHKARYEAGSWILNAGHLNAMAHDILSKQVVWADCNADGSDLEVPREGEE